MIFKDAIATVGKTPLVELGRMARGLAGDVVAKLEIRNPCGSVKDRLAVGLIEDTERRGLLKPGMTLLEATGGNTGIGLAFAAAIRGYRPILTMPAVMSTERVALLRQLGAEIILTPGILMKEAVERAGQLAREIEGSLLLDQFKNPANLEIHRRTTAIEIWEDTKGEVDVFVSAVGTGGTITGVAEVLKARKSSVRAIAVEPAEAAVLSGRTAGTHQMPGIGVGFTPDILNRAVIPISDDDAFETVRQLAREEGVVTGVSAGAALKAALMIASSDTSAGQMIVVLIPDTGERYITTALF